MGHDPLLRVLLPALLFAGCANPEASGLYTATPNEASPSAYALTRVYARGTATTVPLTVQLSGASEDDLLTPSTLNPALGGTTLATFDGGRVTVSWSGTPFLARDAALTVTVAPDATPTGPELDALYSTGSQIILQKTAHITSRAGVITVGIRVRP